MDLKQPLKQVSLLSTKRSSSKKMRLDRSTNKLRRKLIIILLIIVR